MEQKFKIFVGDEVQTNLTIGDLEPAISAYAAETQPDVDKRIAKTRELVTGWKIALQENNTVVLKEEKKIIGIARLTLKGEIDGNPVFEIENLYVGPDSREHGFSKNLRDKLLQNLKLRHPNAYIISCTKQPRVKAVYDRFVQQGIVQDIGHGTYLKNYTKEQLTDEEIQSEIEEGWKAYMFKLSDFHN